VMPVSAAALKAPSAAVAAPVATVVATTASPVSSAPLWSLEARPRVARDSCRIAPLKFRPRRVGIARSPRLARQQNRVFFRDGLGNRALGGGLGSFALYMLDRFLMRYLGPFGLSQYPVLLLRVNFFLVDEFFLVVFLMLGFGAEVLFGSVNFLGAFLGKLFDFSFLVFFIKVVPAHERICLSPRLRLFVLCFYETRGKGRQFLVAKTGGAVAHFTPPFFFFNVLGRRRRRHFYHILLRRSLSRRGFRLSLVVRQDPMWKIARKTAWYARRRQHAGGRTRRRLLEIRLPLFRLLVGYRLDGRLRLAPAVLRERFAREQNVIFAALRRSRSRSAVATSPIIATRITLTLRRSILRRR